MLSPNTDNTLGNWRIWQEVDLNYLNRELGIKKRNGGLRK